MKIWARIFKDNRMLRDTVVENHEDDTRTHKVFEALTQIALEFDLSQPIWLESNIKDFKKYAKVKFGQDSFVEEIDFDYLEMRVLEED